MEATLSQWPDDPPASTRRIRLLAEAAAAFFDIPLDELKSRKRSNELVWPRSICMRMARDAGYSSPVIGKWWKREHSSVLHATKLVNDLRESKPTYETQFRQFVIFAKKYIHQKDRH
jgi:chromosomal replication initiation ATPase DnaA